MKLLLIFGMTFFSLSSIASVNVVAEFHYRGMFDCKNETIHSLEIPKQDGQVIVTSLKISENLCNQLEDAVTNLKKKIVKANIQISGNIEDDFLNGIETKIESFDVLK